MVLRTNTATRSTHAAYLPERPQPRSRPRPPPWKKKKTVISQKNKNKNKNKNKKKPVSYKSALEAKRREIDGAWKEFTDHIKHCKSAVANKHSLNTEHVAKDPLSHPPGPGVKDARECLLNPSGALAHLSTVYADADAEPGEKFESITKVRIMGKRHEDYAKTSMVEAVLQVQTIITKTSTSHHILICAMDPSGLLRESGGGRVSRVENQERTRV